MNVHRSTPLTVEDRGSARINGGKVLHKWYIRFMDGSAGLCWTPEVDENDKQFPCPFTEGKNTYFTVYEEAGKETKIRPFDVQEFDRETRMTRIASVNSAIALGADKDNFKEYANMIYDHVTQPQ